MKITKKSLIIVFLSSCLFWYLFDHYTEFFDKNLNLIYYISIILIMIDYLLINYPLSKKNISNLPLDIIKIFFLYITISIIVLFIIFFVAQKIFPCFNIGPTPYGCIFKSK